MGQPIIQTSFNSGEWAPALGARVDLKQYHSAAALLENFFVDYRGGATTKPGTRYVGTIRSNAGGRLIPFQASQSVSYVLEFTQTSIRFISNGAYVLEAATSITAQTPGSPVVFTDTAHGYSNGDWLFIANTYYIVHNVTVNTFTLQDLFGNNINVNPFTLPVNAQRVYTVTSVYNTNEIYQIKYVQDVNILILLHPNHAPATLTLNVSNTQPSWTFATMTIGATVATPSIASAAFSGSTGSNHWAYLITAVDAFGQESAPLFEPYDNFAAITSGISTIVLNAVTGAVGYNFYRSIVSSAATIPGGVPFGYIGTTSSLTFIDDGKTPNFAIGPPVVQNPFSGSGVQSVTVTGGGSYTPSTTPLSNPTVGFSGGGGTGASGVGVMTPLSVAIVAAGSGFVAGNVYAIGYGMTLYVDSVNGSGGITAAHIALPVYFTGTMPANNITVSPGGGGGGLANAQVAITYKVSSVNMISNGAGYATPPTVTFSYGGATGTSVLGATGAGNPTVPALVQQRLFMGGQVSAPAQFNLSQPGAPFNYNISFPSAADNAIQASITGQQLQTIKSAVPVSAGLLIFTDKNAQLLTGGSNGAPITALDFVVNPQAFSGASDLPPITTPTDILYVQAKNSIVRDLSYNFYLANYVGTDISILSSHLFYGYSLVDWAWAEEPFKLAWAIRNDGVMLSLSFIKEQELIAWSHHTTQGQYKSVCTVVEQTSIGLVDATYVLVQRVVNGQTLSYVERMVELNYPQGYKSAWQVEAGIGYNGAAATTFTGGQHLSGLAVVGLADGVSISFTMPASGTFVFGPGGTPGLTAIANASIVTVGLGFTATIQTLKLDLGEPTAQGKMKKVNAATLRVQNTLSLTMGRTLTTLQSVKDTVLGNVGTMSDIVVTDLVTSDVRMELDPQFDVFGQYYIQQSNPYPATILGLIPEIVLGDVP